MITEWKPISKPQETFLSLPETIKEGFFGGSAGPGKSECLMMYPIVRKYIEKPRFKALFMRRTFPELKREIIPRTKELYSAFGGKFNRADLVWEFPSGASIFFGHCENENDIYKYDSMEINLFLPDELESFYEYMYMYIAFTRVRSSIPDLPSIIRAAGMPGGIGHAWVKKRFIDQAPNGNVILESKSGNKRIFVKSVLADNPRIDQSYSNSLEELPEAEKKAKKYGDWSSYEGQVFSEFRDKKYPDEPENALHVIDQFEIPDWWPRIAAIDWGYTPPAMTYIGYGAISPARQLIIYREQFWQKTAIPEWAAYAKHFFDTESPRVIKLCKSAGQHRGQEHTIYQQISENIGRAVELTDNSPGSRIAGKMLIHEYLRWQEKHVPELVKEKFDQSFAEWLLRNKGPETYRIYLEQYNPPEKERGLPKLLIFKHCHLLIQAIKSCIYAKHNGVDSQDVAEFPGDDPYDVLRYLTDAADKYFDESEVEFQKLEQYQNIMDKFHAGQMDMTMYYRRMNQAEKKEHVTPVTRFHYGASRHNTL